MAALFITFEGLDGSGKTTHLERAVRWLAEHGVACEVTHEPGGTPLGEAIRQLFLDHGWGLGDGTVEALMVFASRRQHLLQVIDPALAAGRHVLCDRFTDSTLVYQGCGRGVPRAVLAELDRLATGARRPDRTLLFDLPPEAARSRGHSARRRGLLRGVDRFDAEDLEFYRRLRDGYLELARQESERIRVISSAGGVEETERQVRHALADLVS